MEPGAIHIVCIRHPDEPEDLVTSRKLLRIGLLLETKTAVMLQTAKKQMLSGGN